MLWNWKLTLIGSTDVSLVTMSSIPLPLHKGNTNWLQFASIGFAPISNRRMRPSPAETSLWQTDLAESIGYSWNMGLLWRLRLWLESMGVGRMQYMWSMHCSVSMTLAHIMSSIRGVMHRTFLPSHCIHQSQFTLCANLSWPFILKNPLTPPLSSIFAVPFSGLSFLSA